MSHPIDISVKTLFKVTLFVIAIWVAYLISDILVMIAFAVIISSAVDNWASNLQKLNIPRVISVIGIYLFFILLLAGIVYLIVPVLLTQVGNLINDLPGYYNKVSSSFGVSDAEKYSFAVDKSQEFLSGIESKLFQAGGGIFFIFKNIFSGIAMVIATFVLSFYLSLQENGVRKFLQFIIPRKYESYVLDLWQRTQKKLGRWLQGQLILGLIIGTLVYIGLSIIGIPYALILAILAGLFELVPMAGPIIASIPAIIIGFLISPLIGILTLGLYVIIQPLENHLIVPQVMRKAVGLNPIVIIIALLIGAKLGGILGMLLAVPAMAVIVEILGDLGEQNKDILI